MIYYNDPTEEIDQCNIFQNIHFACNEGNPSYGILLTPRCDLIIQESRKTPKAKYFKFVSIIDVRPIIEGILSQLRISKGQIKGTEYIDGETYENLVLLIKNFIHGSIYPRYFFIPEIKNHFGFSAIDFQILETKKYSRELIKSLKEKRIAQIKSSWREAIPVRYSNYSSRIGVSDYPVEIIDNLLDSLSINLIRSS